MNIAGKQPVQHIMSFPKLPIALEAFSNTSCFPKNQIFPQALQVHFVSLIVDIANISLSGLW